MKFSKNYYKYIIGVAFSLFVLNVSAREVCFTTPTYVTTTYVGTCMANEVCMSGRTIYITQCVNVPDEYTGSVIPPGSTPVSGSGSVPPPPPVVQPKTCAQMILDVDAVKDACRLIENNTAQSLANGCPNLTHYVEASVSLSMTLRDFFNFAFGTTLGTTYNQQCEARLTFDLGAKLAACDFSASKSKAAIGPCN